MTEKTWSFSLNQAPTTNTDLTAQCRSFVQQLKTFLTGTAGWTITESCDSTQVLASDTWAALTNIVAGTGVHSWMVLKSPAGIIAGNDGTYTGDQSRLWFVIDMNYAVYYQARFRLCSAAPTGGTTSAAPTSTLQQQFSSQQFMRSSYNANAQYNFWCTSEGNFMASTGYTGAGWVPFFLALFPIVDPTEIVSSSQDYPYGFGYFANWADTTLGAPLRSALISSSSMLAFAFNGTTSGAGMNCIGLGTAWVGANWGSTGDSINSRQSASDVFISCEEASKYGMIGRVPDIYGSSQAIAQGTVDSNTSPTLVKLGSLLLPTNAILSI